jgi:phosphate acyltransferase
MNTLKRIGIDLMGGDALPLAFLDAVIQALAKLPHCQFVLYTTSEYHQEILAKLDPNLPVSIVVVSDVILPQDHPLKAIRSKPDSSLVQGVEAISQKKIDAFISCGNTGALIAASTMLVPHFPHIKRPALLAELPSYAGPLAVLDVGGGISATTEQLIQFASIGCAYAKVRYKTVKPRVALLNIGVESEKGTDELKEAYQELSNLKNAPFEFVGNVEANVVFTSPVDVLVTSGFAGNIFLKTAEGISSFVLTLAQEKIAQNEAYKALLPVLRELKASMSYEASQGALISGLDGIVIKCHGSSSNRALFNAILGANALIESNLLEKMKLALA